MRCKICSKEFTPRQVYCSSSCRIKSFRKKKNESVTEKNDNVTSRNESVTEQSGNGNVNVTESIESSNSRLLRREAIREFKEKLMKSKTVDHLPFDICPKHKVFFTSCKCK
jgi:hypothetical protein